MKQILLSNGQKITPRFLYLHPPYPLQSGNSGRGVIFSFLLILCCSLLVSLPFQAQTFTNYTTDDGLINNTVNCLAIDVDDNLWFGTQEGVSFFDGINWTNFDVNSHPNLVSNTITAIAVDRDNNLWVGTDFGVSRFDGATWTTYTDDDGLADNRVRFINQDSQGNMWFANNDGISIFDGTNWVSYVRDDGLPFGGTNYVTFDAMENVWLGTPLGGVYIFDGSTFTTLTEDEGLLNDKVRSIAIDANQYKWVGTSDGVSVFDENNAWVTNHEIIFELPPPDELNPVEDVQVDSQGNVWVGVYVDYLVTEGGITVFDGSTWEDFDVSDGLAGPVVRRLAIDSKDNVWIATSTGVSKTNNIFIGIDEVVDAAIRLYPNPATSSFMVNVPHKLQGTSYQLLNILGKTVLKGEIQKQELTLNVEDLTSGIYFLVMGEGYMRKIIKK